MFKNNKKNPRITSIFRNLDYKLRSFLVKLTCIALLPLVIFLYINVMRGNFLNVLSYSLSIYLSIYINRSVQGRC